MFTALYFVLQVFKSLKSFGTSIASLDPETVELPASSIPCGPTEKLSLALVPRLDILRMIVKLASRINCLAQALY